MSAGKNIKNEFYVDRKERKKKKEKKSMTNRTGGREKKPKRLA